MAGCGIEMSTPSATFVRMRQTTEHRSCWGQRDELVPGAGHSLNVNNSACIVHCLKIARPENPFC